ncbi:MAG: hypothetical protein KAY32_02160 [Candidatus Eisenbacteria sp.]|nr:hypothetical protein [Candidatus Eisenbacteria bacterium]
MTTRSESGGGRRIGRILSLMGDLLQEMGTLVQDGAKSASAAFAEPEAGGESTPAAPPAAVSEAQHPAGAPAKPAAASATAEGLWLVAECDDVRMALPWSWVSGTQLSSEGTLESFQVNDGECEMTLRVDRVLGLWTRKEAEAWQEQLEWLTSAGSIPVRPAAARSPRGLDAGPRDSRQAEAAPASGPFPASDPSPATGPSPASGPSQAAFRMNRPASQPVASPPVAPETMPPGAVEADSGPTMPAPPAVDSTADAAPHRVSSMPVGASPSESWPPSARTGATQVEDARQAESSSCPAVIEAPPWARDEDSRVERVWIVSPSALARRFLMRHLRELGADVLEARDLDDPLLPADLKGGTALFLDESLLEDWKARPASTRGAPPLVCLTVDGALSVPREGTSPPGGAILPRPFERSEVERVIHWLRSLRQGSSRGGYGDDGEEDDTWFFADPFGAARAGEHSCR